jgi:hypothetical protein
MLNSRVASHPLPPSYPSGQHGYVMDTQEIKHKLKDLSRLARYLSRTGESSYRIYYIDTNTFGTARAADFRPYNPNKDPVVMAPVPVLVLPLSREVASEAPTTAEHDHLASTATSVTTLVPISDVDPVPVLPAAITNYEIEVFKAPEDGCYAYKVRKLTSLT